MGFIKDNKLIKRVALVRCLRKDLQQDDKETQRFILFDECITQINDNLGGAVWSSRLRHARDRHGAVHAALGPSRPGREALLVAMERAASVVVESAAEASQRETSWVCACLRCGTSTLAGVALRGPVASPKNLQEAEICASITAWL